MSSFSSYNPATGEPTWTGPVHGPVEIDLALESARIGYAEWSARPASEREAVLRTFAQKLEQRKNELADAISREVGKPTWEALTEVRSMIGKVAISIEAHARRCAEFCGGGAVTRFRPHGVVAVLGPFNFPGHLPNGHIVPALLAGNTVVFKPSEQAPLVAELTLSIWQDAGLPKSALHIINGGSETGATLIGHPAIDGVFFTGSAQAGMAISQSLAQSPQKILALEMGGNNPLVVWSVSDLRAAALLAVQSAFLSAGQRCTCARRLIISSDNEGARFLAELLSLVQRIRVGPHTDRPEPFMGPVISAGAARNLLKVQETLLTAGAQPLHELRLLRPGTRLLSPGLLDVTKVLDRPDTEYFGPLLQVVRVSTFAAALEEASATRFGLAAGLLSDDPVLYQQFQHRARFGIVNWNHALTGASSGAPFGGVGLSGNHRPSAYFAADYCSYPVASLEAPALAMPASLPAGIDF